MHVFVSVRACVYNMGMCVHGRGHVCVHRCGKEGVCVRVCVCVCACVHVLFVLVRVFCLPICTHVCMCVLGKIQIFSKYQATFQVVINYVL